MDDNSEISRGYTFSPPIDLPTMLETLQIQYLDVNKTRALVIFNSAILNLECTQGTLTELKSAVIAVYELPRETSTDKETQEPLSFIDRFVNQIVSTDQMTVSRHE